MISPTQAKFLQGIIASAHPRSDGQSATYCAEQFHVGVRIGRMFEYTATDVEKAIGILQSNGYSLAAANEPVSRASMLHRVGESEKSGTAAPHDDLFAYRVLVSPARIDGALTSPNRKGTYTVGRSREFLSAEISHVLVVENFETFVELDSYQWVLDWLLRHGCTSVVAIFRGDNMYKTEVVHQLLLRLPHPLLSFCDFDPAGVHLSAKLPRLEAIVAPALDVLRERLAGTKRFDLFQQQAGVVGTALDRCECQVTLPLWAVIKSLGRGYPQEWTKDWVL